MNRYTGSMVGIVIFTAACQRQWQPHSMEWDAIGPESQRERIVADARELSHSREYRVEGRRFSYDCSGYVGAALLLNGIDVFKGASELDIRGNGVRILYEFVSKYGWFDSKNARPGDLVFFSNTYDRNRDGKRNDLLTHVGIVERVEDDGTVVFFNFLRGKVVRNSINLSNPIRHTSSDGKISNDYLRKKRRHERLADTLAASLFDGFGSLVQEPSPPERLTSNEGSFTPIP